MSFIGLYFIVEIRVKLNLFFCLYLRLYEKFLVLYPEATVRHSVIQQRQKSFVHDHLQDLSGGVILRSTVKTVKELAEWNDLLKTKFNPLNPELNPICYLLALLGGHHFLHVSRIRVKLLTLRRLMSYIYIYIYGAPILNVSRSHTTTQHSR